MAQNLSGPGMLFVNSKISQPDILDEKTYMHWYDDDHIAEITETSGIKSARRFIDIDPNADKPYLAMYPMDDIAFVKGDEFKKIKVKSDILPGSGICYDLADIDVRTDNLIQVYDPTKKGKGHTKTLITAQFQLKDDFPSEQLDRWYREEHLERLAKADGYLRTTRFKLAFARSNAQSRALKGLPTTDEPPPEPPVWISLHEFSTETVDMVKLRELTGSEWTKKIHAGTKKSQFNTYKVAKEFGEKDWFHNVEL